MKRKLLSLFLVAVMMLGTLLMSIPTFAAEINYSDVNKDMWSYGDIIYVTENGLMNGTGGSTFSPTMSLTRGMVVTVLYRMEGAQRIYYKDLFVDVDSRAYYADAVVWAKEKGICEISLDSSKTAEGFYLKMGFTKSGISIINHGNVVFRNTVMKKVIQNGKAR